MRQFSSKCNKRGWWCTNQPCETTLIPCMKIADPRKSFCGPSIECRWVQPSLTNCGRTMAPNSSIHMAFTWTWLLQVLNPTINCTNTTCHSWYVEKCPSPRFSAWISDCTTHGSLHYHQWQSQLPTLSVVHWTIVCLDVSFILRYIP